LEAHFIQDFIEVLFASAGLNDFGLSASDIKAYVLNRHLKTLAGIIFDLPAKQGLNLFLNHHCNRRLDRGCAEHPEVLM